MMGTKSIVKITKQAKQNYLWARSILWASAYDLWLERFSNHTAYNRMLYSIITSDRKYKNDFS